MPEQSARLAAVVTWLANPDAEEIDAETLLNAVTLAAHYGSESLRLMHVHLGYRATSPTPSASRMVQGGWTESHVSISDISQYGPDPLGLRGAPAKLLACWRAIITS